MPNEILTEEQNTKMPFAAVNSLWTSIASTLIILIKSFYFNYRFLTNKYGAHTHLDNNINYKHFTILNLKFEITLPFQSVSLSLILKWMFFNQSGFKNITKPTFAPLKQQQLIIPFKHVT